MNAEIKNMTEEQITDLKAQIADWEKAKERKPLVFRPATRQTYFAIADEGHGVERYSNFNPVMTNNMIANGDCFETQELAEAELKRRQVVRQVEELADKYDPERGGAFVVGGNNYTYRYDVKEDTVKLCWWCSSISNPMLPNFSSRAIAGRILEEVGEDNIKLLFMKYPIIMEEN